MGKVVNIKNGDSYDVYIGRAGKDQDGYFGNPFNTGSRQQKLTKFEEYLIRRIEDDLEYRERVKNLDGKVLGCFCKPEPCHGDILLKYAKRLKIEDEVFKMIGE